MRPFQTLQEVHEADIDYSDKDAMEAIPGTYVILRHENYLVYVKTEAARDALITQLRLEGRSIETTEATYYNRPRTRWIASYPEETKRELRFRNTKGKYFLEVPVQVIIELANKPIPRSKELYERACAQSGIISDPDYYYQDKQDERWCIRHTSECNDFIVNFSEITRQELDRFYFEDFPKLYPGANLAAGASFTRALRDFLWPDNPGSKVEANGHAAFMGILAVTTGMEISPEMTRAAGEAISDMSSDERKAFLGDNSS